MSEDKIFQLYDEPNSVIVSSTSLNIQRSDMSPDYLKACEIGANASIEIAKANTETANAAYGIPAKQKTWQVFVQVGGLVLILLVVLLITYMRIPEEDMSKVLIYVTVAAGSVWGIPAIVRSIKNKKLAE